MLSELICFWFGFITCLIMFLTGGIEIERGEKNEQTNKFN